MDESLVIEGSIEGAACPQKDSLKSVTDHGQSSKNNVVSWLMGVMDIAAPSTVVSPIDSDINSSFSNVADIITHGNSEQSISESMNDDIDSHKTNPQDKTENKSNYHHHHRHHHHRRQLHTIEHTEVDNNNIQEYRSIEISEDTISSKKKTENIENKTPFSNIYPVVPSEPQNLHDSSIVLDSLVLPTGNSSDYLNIEVPKNTLKNGLVSRLKNGLVSKKNSTSIKQRRKSKISNPEPSTSGENASISESSTVKSESQVTLSSVASYLISRIYSSILSLIPIKKSVFSTLPPKVQVGITLSSAVVLCLVFVYLFVLNFDHYSNFRYVVFDLGNTGYNNGLDYLSSGGYGQSICTLVSKSIGTESLSYYECRNNSYHVIIMTLGLTTACTLLSVPFVVLMLVPLIYLYLYFSHPELFEKQQKYAHYFKLPVDRNSEKTVVYSDIETPSVKVDLLEKSVGGLDGRIYGSTKVSSEETKDMLSVGSVIEDTINISDPLTKEADNANQQSNSSLNITSADKVAIENKNKLCHESINIEDFESIMGDDNV